MSDDLRYAENLKEFANLVERARHYSQFTHMTYTEDRKQHLASVLFVGVVLRGYSLLRLIPGTEWHPRETGQLDLASIAAVARSFTEACQMFYYLGVETVGQDVWSARFAAARLHSLVERRAMFRRLGDGGSADDREITEYIDKFRAELKGNRYFATLDERERKKCLESGATTVGTTSLEVAEHFLGDRDLARFVHKWLSSYTHQHPFAFLSASMERGRGVENKQEAGLIVMILSTCEKYLRPACMYYEDQFPKLRAWVEDTLDKVVRENRERPTKPVSRGSE
jgi:hypothetical protein